MALSTIGCPFRFTSWTDGNEYTFKVWAIQFSPNITKADIKISLMSYAGSTPEGEIRLILEEFTPFKLRNTLKVRKILYEGMNFDPAAIYTKVCLLLRQEIYRMLSYLSDPRRQLLEISVTFSSNFLPIPIATIDAFWQGFIATDSLFASIRTNVCEPMAWLYYNAIDTPVDAGDAGFVTTDCVSFKSSC